MNPERTNLRHEHHAEQAAAQEHFQQSESQAQVLEFSTVEDLLRHDSEQNPVPPEVAERLGRSLEKEPRQAKPWYRKLFG